jgi:hypothetical protein
MAQTAQLFALLENNRPLSRSRDTSPSAEGREFFGFVAAAWARKRPSGGVFGVFKGL